MHSSMSEQEDPTDPNAPTEIDAAAAFRAAAETSPAIAATPDVSPLPFHWEPPTVEELDAQLPAFKVEKLLGRGGMGAVYQAEQISLTRPVALKILPPEFASDGSFAKRFEREAKSLAQLNHANIVQIYDFGQTEAGHYYFVMEFVDGTDFHYLIQTGQLDPAGALNAVSQICDALAYAHEQGFVHRDIKPANIFLNSQGVVKVGDFGLAKIMGTDTVGPSAESALTGSGQSMGTPFYSAPEQMAGEHVDQRADIYSLGVMFYEMLTGQVPRGHFDPPSKKVAIDVRLDEVVLKAMAEEPDRRYQTVLAVQGDVDAIRMGDSPAEAVAKTDQPPAKRRRGVAVAGMILGVIGLAGAAFYGFTNRKDGVAVNPPDGDSSPGSAEVSATTFPLQHAHRRGRLVAVPFDPASELDLSKIPADLTDVESLEVDPASSNVFLVREGGSVWCLDPTTGELESTIYGQFRGAKVHAIDSAYRLAVLTLDGRFISPLKPNDAEWQDSPANDERFIGMSGGTSFFLLQNVKGGVSILSQLDLASRFKESFHEGRFTKVDAGHAHGLALREDGTVATFGGYSANGRTPGAKIPIDLPPVRDIAAVGLTSWVITADGKVRAWGFPNKDLVAVDRLANSIENSEALYSTGASGTGRIAIRHPGNRWTVLRDFRKTGVPTRCPEAAAQLEGCEFVGMNANFLVGILPTASERQLTEPAKPKSIFPLKPVAAPGELVLVPLPPEDGASATDPVPDPSYLAGIHDAVFANLSSFRGFDGTAIRADGTLWNLQKGKAPVPISDNAHQAEHHWGEQIVLRRDGSLVDTRGTPIGEPNARYRELQQHSAACFAITDDDEMKFILPREGEPSWGSLTQFPPIDPSVASLSIGNGHALALSKDGRMVSWGLNTGGVVTATPSFGNVRSVAAASNTSFAIFGSGRVAAWGARIVSNTTNIEAIQFQKRLGAIGDAEELFSAGEQGVLGIRHRGNHWSIARIYGDGSWEFLDDVAEQLEGCHFITLNGTAIIGIHEPGTGKPPTEAANPPSIFPLKHDHRPGRPVVVSLDPSDGAEWKPVPDDLTDVIDIAVSAIDPLCTLVRSDGYVSYFDPEKGSVSKAKDRQSLTHSVVNAFPTGFLSPDGRFESGEWPGSSQWMNPPDPEMQFRQASSGSEMFLLLTQDGGVHAYGKSSLVPKYFSNLPKEPGIVKVSAGYLHGLALTDAGNVIGFGGNLSGGKTHICAIIPSGLPRIVDIAAVNSTSWAVTAEGRVEFWGYRQDISTQVRSMIEDISDAERVFSAGAAYPAGAIRRKGNRWMILRGDIKDAPIACPEAAAALEGCEFVAMNKQIAVGILPVED